MANAFSVPVAPDWEEFVACIQRKGTPRRVHFIELFLDPEVHALLCERYDLLKGLDPQDPYFGLRKEIILQRFLGYDYVRCSLEGMDMPCIRAVTEDTAGLQRQNGRSYIDEHKGAITTWEEFEKYPWPDPHKATAKSLEWYERNLPDDMCVVIFGGFAHFAEYLNWLMGYETLCFALYEQRDLVKAIADRLVEMYRVVLRRVLEFSRVKVIWGSDDMGFRSGPLIGPADLREFVLPGHKLMAQMTHDAGRPYILHSCGNLATIMTDLIDDVKIDGKHSFEDTIERVTEVKDTYGRRIALLGGIDVDFLCRSDEAAIRRRVRDTLAKCQPGGGYCLGTGNSVANYIPVDHYLAMLDEGRRYAKS